MEIDPDQVTRAFDAAVGRGGRTKTVSRGPFGHDDAASRSAGGVAELLQKHPGAVLTGAVALVICAVVVVLWAVWPDAPERSIPERRDTAGPVGIRARQRGPASDDGPAPTEPAAAALRRHRRRRRPTAERGPDGDSAAPRESNGARRISTSDGERPPLVRVHRQLLGRDQGRAGHRLYGELGRAGTSLELVGQAPFRILLGNAPGVTLQFNGERVALSPHTRNNVGTLVLGQ